MSGHSKWHNIQTTKNKMDAQRGKIFTKIGREIAVAVRLGGGDPNTNSKLYDVIQKAKQNNMPNDNINRSIKKAMGETDGKGYDAITYEGYGPHGVAFLVQCLTDNRNRSAADVRHLFDRHGGNLGTSGSVMYMFNYLSIFVVENSGISEDELMLIALDAGADDVQMDEGNYVIIASPEKFHSVSVALAENNINIISGEMQFVPTSLTTLDESQSESVQKLIDALEDLDDVQKVYTNADFA